jgi:transcriptional regulator with XRE-family HTH domain
VSQRSVERNISGKRVAKARGAKKPPLTQEELSGRLALLGVQMDRAAVAKVENNLRRVLDYELKALSIALGVSVDWLLGGER